MDKKKIFEIITFKIKLNFYPSLALKWFKMAMFSAENWLFKVFYATNTAQYQN